MKNDYLHVASILKNCFQSGTHVFKGEGPCVGGDWVDH